MKMKMIPTGNYLLVDIFKDLADRYVNLAYPEGRPKLPNGKDAPTGLPGMQDFTASYEIQQSLLDEFMIGYFTDFEDIKKIPRGFWRDKTGNDAIWSGMTPEGMSAQSEWIFVSRINYSELLAALGMTDVPGNGLVRESQDTIAESSGRRPMSGADIETAVELLKAEMLTKSLNREEQKLWVFQTFANKKVTEGDWRRIYPRVPAKKGRPRKSEQ